MSFAPPGAAPTMNRIRWGRVEYARDGRKVAITDPMEPGKNPALDSGVRLPGFNDGFTGAAPDIGAFESGRPALRFGRERIRIGQKIGEHDDEVEDYEDAS